MFPLSSAPQCGDLPLTRLQILTSKSHHVTSIIRNPDQIPQIQTLGPSNLITPKVFSIEEATDDSIPPLLNGIDWVIWSAGTSR